MACPLSALDWLKVLNRRALQLNQQPVKGLQHPWLSSSRACLLSLKTLEKPRKKLMSSNSGKRGQFEMHYMKTTDFQQCCYSAIILCQSVCWEEVRCYSFYLSFHLSFFLSISLASKWRPHIRVRMAGLQCRAELNTPCIDSHPLLPIGHFLFGTQMPSSFLYWRKQRLWLSVLPYGLPSIAVCSVHILTYWIHKC